MFDALFGFSIITTGVQLLKEACTPIIPAENWANKELYYKDRANNVSIEQCIENAQNGRYKQVSIYPKPHRDIDGKIIIENNKLYYDDLLTYGAVQTKKWVEQGKYNLTKEELELEKKRLEEKYERLCSY